MAASVVSQSLADTWASMVGFVPNILSALIVLALGLIFAAVLGQLASKVAKILKLDDLLARLGLIQKMESYGVHFSLAALFGWLVKWFLIIVILIAVAEILGWRQVTVFLQSVALYIPNVIIAVIIMTVGLIAAHFVHNVVEQGLKVTKAPTTAGKFLASLAKWSIVVFAVMASFIQLGVAARLIEILFTGIVAMLALAGGLAFGLGGKERANRWLEAIEKELCNK